MHRNGALLSIVGALFFICVTVWAALYANNSQASGHLTFAVLNIGQGDSLFIEGPTGFQVLVDAGPSTGAVLRELPTLMPFGDRSLDVAIETHPDADHMGGFLDVLENYKVAMFVEPGIDKHNGTIDHMEAEVDAQHIARVVARAGQQIDLGGGALLTILYPDIDVTDYGSKTNDGCIVAKLTYGTASALLTCDAPIDVEEHLIAVYGTTTLDSDILKVGHHGSRYSTGDDLLDAVTPNVAIISVGKNSYGHPTAETLGRLVEHGVPVLRTDQKGTIVCVSDGAQFSCK